MSDGDDQDVGAAYGCFWGVPIAALCWGLGYWLLNSLF